MIPPGGEGQIKVTLHPKGRATHIKKSVTVMSDDPETPNFSLTLEGRLLVDVVVTPTSLRIPDLRKGEAGSVEFKLSRPDGSSAKVTSVTVEDGENFRVEAVEGKGAGTAGSSKDAKDVEYRVHFSGRKSIGISHTRIRVTTDGENTPEVFIPVRAEVAKNLRYIKQLRFARRNGEIQDRHIHISSRHGDAPKIESVKDPDGLLEFEVEEAEGPRVSIAVRVRKAALEALPEAQRLAPHQLHVRTDDAEEPELVFTYRIAPESKDAGVGIPATSASEKAERLPTAGAPRSTAKPNH